MRICQSKFIDIEIVTVKNGYKKINVKVKVKESHVIKKVLVSKRIV